MLRLFPAVRWWVLWTLVWALAPLENAHAQEAAPFRLMSTSAFTEVRARQETERSRPSGRTPSATRREQALEEEFGLATQSYLYHPNLAKLDLAGGLTLVQERSRGAGEDEAGSGAFTRLLARLSLLENNSFPSTLYYSRTTPVVSLAVAERYRVTHTRYGGSVAVRAVAPVVAEAEVYRETLEGTGARQVTDETTDHFGLTLHAPLHRAADLHGSLRVAQRRSASGASDLAITETERTVRTAEISSSHVLGEAGDLKLQNRLVSQWESTSPRRRVLRFTPSGQWKITQDLGAYGRYTWRDSETNDTSTTNRGMRLLLGPVRLDPTGQVQCTSCHDPHDDTYPPFLVTSNHESALCRVCHRPAGWEASAHASSSAPLSGAAEDRWSHARAATVGGAACLACHKTHTAQESERLLLRTWEEDNCLICHDGSVAAANVQVDFQKVSRHPIEGYFHLHDPVEPAVVTTRHVECADCHNPHAVRAGEGVDGPLAEVRGVSATGAEVAAASEAYQVCLRCHGDSPGLPAPRVNRLVPQTNVRLEFDPANPSFHPVVAATGRAVPSVEPDWAGRQLGCTDCHGSDQGPAAGGAGPKGVHGSAYAPLLVLPYTVTDGAVESAAAYALCYKCHSRISILADASFPLHQEHVVDERTPCSVCHDPHGVSRTQGTAVNNAWLINFDVGVVSANAAGQLRFDTPGDGTGSCALNCHGIEHAPKVY